MQRRFSITVIAIRTPAIRTRLSRTPRAAAVALAIGCASFLVGCSPSTFTGDTSDSRVEGQRSPRGPSPTCTAFKLAGAEVSAKDLRALVACFNANGSIGPIASLVDRLDDASLAPVVRALNVGVLSDADVRRESYEILVKLKRDGKLDSTIAALGGFLADPAALARLARNGAGSPLLARFDFGGAVAASSDGASPSGDIDPERGYAALDALARAVRQPSFASFREKTLARTDRPVRGSSIANRPFTDSEGAELRRAIRSLVATLGKSENVRLLRDRKTALEAYRLVRAITGATPDAFRAQAPGTLRVLRELTGSNGKRLDTVTDLISTLSGPVDCMHGARVFTAPWTDITTEFRFQKGPRLRRFVTDFAATVGLVVQDFCTVPREFYSRFPDFYRLVGTSWGERALDWVGALGEAGIVDPLSRLLVEIAPDLKPILAAFDGDEIVLDAFLLASSLPDADVVRVLGGNERSVSPRTATTSAFPSVSATPRGTDFREWSDAETLSAGRALRDLLVVADPARTGPALDAALSLFRGTQTHPWWRATIRIARSFGAAPSTTAKVDLPEAELERAIDFIREMSEDGRLSSLLLDFYRLFQRAGQTVPDTFLSEAWEGAEPFHSLALGRDVAPAPIESRLSKRDEACLRLKYDRPWNAQFADYFECLDSPPGAGSTVEAVSKLDAEGLFSPVIELFSKWPWSTEQFHRMLPEFSKLLGSSELPVLLDSVREFGDRALRPIALAVRAHSPKAFLDHVAAWSTPAENWAALSAVLAKDPVAPPARIEGRGKVPSAEAFDAFLLGKECIQDPAARVARRNEIFADSRHYAYGANRAALADLYAWTRSPSFAKWLEGLAIATRGAPGASARLSSRALVDFLHAHAGNPKLISTYSESRGGLEVKMLSGIEQLETLLTEANFKLPTFGNFALKFVTDIAFAWGDEPFATWPAEVRARYPRGGAPSLGATIAELRRFLDRWEGIAGLPKVRNCDDQVALALPPDPSHAFQPLAFILPMGIKSRLFNIHQTLPWVEAEAGGGMKVVRELAFQFWRADSLPQLIALGEAGGLHAASAAFAYREDPFVGKAEARALSLVLDGASVAPAELSAVASRFLNALPEDPVAGSEDEDAGATVDLGNPNLHRSIDAALFAFATIDERTVGDAARAYSASFASHPSEWAEGIARAIRIARESAGASSTADPAGWEAAMRTLFAREGRTRPIARLLATWGRDPDAFAFLAEVTRLTLQTGDLAPSNLPRPAPTRDVLADQARSFVAFLAETADDPRGQAARALRERVLSEGLRGDTTARWLAFLARDPEAASVAIDGLLRGLSGDEFKQFLMTAGRQLPH